MRAGPARALCLTWAAVVVGTATAAGFTAFKPGEVKVGGEIGHHIDLTVGKILHHIDFERDFVRHFRNRTDPEGTVKDIPKDGPYGGFVGYGMLLDAMVSASARGIGGEEMAGLTRRRLAELVSLQGDDGSISVFKSIPRGKISWPQRAIWDNHESSYILQALTADYLAFGTKATLEAAKHLADHMIEREEPVNIGGEAAFIRLWTATGDSRYRDWLFKTAGIDKGLADYDKIVSANGTRHVYTALARACAQIDFARAEKTDDVRYLAPARELMARLLGPYSSVSGSCSAGPHEKAWGETWMTSQRGTGRWGETCATAYMMRFAARMMSVDAASVYGDLIERGLYNAFFSAQSLDGLTYRYFTPFEGASEWWPRDTYCCPNNFRREMFEVVDAVFLKTPSGVAVNLYSDATLTTGGLKVEMRTDYPDGREIALTVESAKPLELALRIPRWCSAAEVSHLGGKDRPQAGAWHRVRLPEGRSSVYMVMPMKDRRVAGREEQAGKAAIVQGPVVYGRDAAGMRVRYCDGSRVSTYFVPPKRAETVPDELFAPDAPKR